PIIYGSINVGLCSKWTGEGKSIFHLGLSDNVWSSNSCLVVRILYVFLRRHLTFHRWSSQASTESPSLIANLYILTDSCGYTAITFPILPSGVHTAWPTFISPMHIGPMGV